MIWSVATESSWLKLSQLEPVRVLDDVDGPRLFTVLADSGQSLLAYMCGEDDKVERFLLVPTSDRIIQEIANNKVSLRDALTQQALMWMVDRQRDGSLSTPMSVDYSELPESALPRAGAYLGPMPRTALRVRLTGAELVPGMVPASVVKRAVEGTTNAIKTLFRHVLEMQKDAGRPTEWFRRYYDLPTTGFAFRSFEVSFGLPEPPAQQDLAEDKDVLKKVSGLLAQGLEWASATSEKDVPKDLEWAAIVEAISHLTPPQKGVVETVEVSGILANCPRGTITLSRTASERVGYARKKLAAHNPSEVTYEGVVREFDKDLLTFWLRQPDGTDILHVTFTPDQYNDALLAFDTEKLVTVFAYRTASKSGDLISIAFKGDGSAQPVEQS